MSIIKWIPRKLDPFLFYKNWKRRERERKGLKKKFSLVMNWIYIWQIQSERRNSLNFNKLSSWHYLVLYFWDYYLFLYKRDFCCFCSLSGKKMTCFLFELLLIFLFQEVKKIYTHDRILEFSDTQGLWVKEEWSNLIH